MGCKRARKERFYFTYSNHAYCHLTYSVCCRLLVIWLAPDHYYQSVVVLRVVLWRRVAMLRQLWYSLKIYLTARRAPGSRSAGVATLWIIAVVGVIKAIRAATMWLTLLYFNQCMDRYCCILEYMRSIYGAVPIHAGNPCSGYCFVLQRSYDRAVRPGSAVGIDPFLLWQCRISHFWW